MADEEVQVEEKIEFEPVGDKEIIEDSELSVEQAEKLVKELRTGEKIFEFDGTKYKIKMPSMNDIQEADFEYSKTFTKAIQAGLPTRKSLEDDLVKRGILDNADAFDNDTQKRREEIRRLEVKLKAAEKAGNKKLMVQNAEKLAHARAESYDAIMYRSSVLGNSAEARADERRTTYLMTRSISYAENEDFVWPDYADYLRETDHALVNKVSYEYLSFTTGITANFMEEFPEVKILEQG